MKFLTKIRRRFGWKIFISYLIVTMVGIIVLATAVRFLTPAAYDRRAAILERVLQNTMIQQTGELETRVLNNYLAGLTEALLIALLAAVLVAVIVSLFVTRQVVAPVQDMLRASQRIADGHYDERVHVPGDVGAGELDELAELALSFNQMTARLERTETIRRQLIGDVAHELRTPLTAIKGSMEGLIDGILPGEAETYQQIFVETERMQRLVDDLQELSRVEAGAYELNRHNIAVADLVKTAIHRLGRQFEEKGVLLENTVPDELPLVFVDEGRINQVMINLIGNALQYTTSGGSVRIGAKASGAELEIWIQDNGIGLSADQLSLVFTRFYRVEKSRSRGMGGSGIGLTIAKYLVEAHSGRIWAESAGLGQGSSFHFTLPVV